MNLTEPRPSGAAPKPVLCVESVGDVCVVRFVRAAFQPQNGGNLQREIASLTNYSQRLLFNLSGTIGLSAVVIAGLVRVRNRAVLLGGEVHLCGVPPRLGEFLKRSRVNRLFVISPNEAAALNALQPRV